MAKNFLVLAILCTSSFLLSSAVNGAEETQNEESKKSKRAVDVYNNNFSNPNDLTIHNSPDNSESLELSPKDDSFPFPIAKRAPSGFTGMRGKKQMEYTDLSPNDLDWIFDDDDYTYTDLRNKKAPSGFNGVRGKKLDQYDYETSLLDQLIQRLYRENNGQADTYQYNLPLNSLDYPLSEEWGSTYEKRAPVGFTGMRGKRLLFASPTNGKRNPNAFFGVRGKRDYKRSAVEQFNSGYFGMRGKKQPAFLGFRNKFVGVRGKKDGLKPQLLKIPVVSNYRTSSRYFVEPVELLPLKRTPNGFLGMRGKRQANTDTLEAGL